MWPRGGTRIADADAARFRARRAELGLGPLVIHDNYLINLASPDRVMRTRSIQAFHDELVRAVSLGADFLVAHPGSGLGSEKSQAIAEIAQGMRQAARGMKLGGLADPGREYVGDGIGGGCAIRGAESHPGSDRRFADGSLPRYGAHVRSGLRHYDRGRTCAHDRRGGAHGGTGSRVCAARERFEDSARLSRGPASSTSAMERSVWRRSAES